MICQHDDDFSLESGGDTLNHNTQNLGYHGNVSALLGIPPTGGALIEIKRDINPNAEHFSV